MEFNSARPFATRIRGIGDRVDKPGGTVAAARVATRVRVLNAQFDVLRLSETVDAVFRLMQTGRRGWLCTVNVAILMMMRRDARLRSFVERAAITVADGQPIVWGAPWLARPLPERVTGVDLIDALCARAAVESKRVFLLGASAEIVAKAAQHLRARFPTLHIDYADGYFRDDEAAGRAERIRAAKADILIVGMGVPRQERFIEEQWDRLGAPVAIGVGGSFDVLAGVRLRAPLWMQRLGMEWLFRLVQEPRRLLARYLVTNSQFLWLFMSALLASIVARPSPEPATQATDTLDLAPAEVVKDR